MSCDLVEVAINRMETCFSYSVNKRFKDSNGKIVFSKFHSEQNIADQTYYLNRILHAADWFYEIDLPECFSAEHPVGSVLGREKYGNMLFIYQNCTIGSSLLKFPEIGNNVVLCDNASVFGNSVIGDNVIISTGTTILNKHIPNNSIVYSDMRIETISYDQIIHKISQFTDFGVKYIKENNKRNLGTKN